ncbi:CLUMA_CG009222, isoform A [Clunio marinus]|uniref:CLUMA_CG009222, isoform A n=1 Tax=Clunio marinus TaxID=568069 RepID=A0A1J1I645_9DIPT|nr:CLUMA_CG009222, isoform A [Clunio marinus]
MKTLTFVLVAIVIAVDARKVCVPVPDEDPCAAIVEAAMPIWQETAQMLANLNIECSNELSALSFANGDEFDAFNGEFYTTGHCMTSYNSYTDSAITSLGNIVGASYNDYYDLFFAYSESVGDALCLAQGDASLVNAFNSVVEGWNNIIQSKKPGPA